MINDDDEDPVSFLIQSYIETRVELLLTVYNSSARLSSLRSALVVVGDASMILIGIYNIVR